MTDLIVREIAGEYVALDPDSLEAHALTGDAADEYRAATSEGISRRSALKRAGLVAAGAGVASIVLPMAAAAASAPLTATLTPTHGTVTTTVTVTGTGYLSSAPFTITFNGTQVQTGTTAVNGSINTTFTPPAGTPTGASYNVVIATGSRTLTRTYIVDPTFTSIVPSVFTHGTTTNLVTITGTGFQPGVTVTAADANYVISNVVRVSSTQITLTVQDTYSNSGSHQSAITITNPVGGGAVTVANAISNQ